MSELREFWELPRVPMITTNRTWPYPLLHPAFYHDLHPLYWGPIFRPTHNQGQEG